MNFVRYRNCRLSLVLVSNHNSFSRVYDFNIWNSLFITHCNENQIEPKRFVYAHLCVRLHTNFLLQKLHVDSFSMCLVLSDLFGWSKWNLKCNKLKYNIARLHDKCDTKYAALNENPCLRLGLQMMLLCHTKKRILTLRQSHAHATHERQNNKIFNSARMFVILILSISRWRNGIFNIIINIFARRTPSTTRRPKQRKKILIQ